MEIILQHKGKEQCTDCVVQYGRGVKAGEIAFGISDLGEDAIFIGVGDVDTETFEDGLFSGLKDAMAAADGKGYQTIALDVDSFAPDPSLTFYILNSILDCLIEWRVFAPAFCRKIYLRYTDYQTEESLLHAVEKAIFTPVKVNENQCFREEISLERKVLFHGGETKKVSSVSKKEEQSFGEYGDPLEKEFQEFLKEFSKYKSFRKYLLELIDEKGFSKYSDVYKKCGVSKSTFSKVTNYALPDYKPSKNTVAALAIGLELDMDDAQKFFHAAGYHLDRTEKMDQILRFFIEKKIYNIRQINECLNYFGIPVLGEHSRDDCVRTAQD